MERIEQPHGDCSMQAAQELIFNVINLALVTLPLQLFVVNACGNTRVKCGYNPRD